eukprot:3789557-Rhodomonas_salina.1
MQHILPVGNKDRGLETTEITGSGHRFDVDHFSRRCFGLNRTRLPDGSQRCGVAFRRIRGHLFAPLSLYLLFHSHPGAKTSVGAQHSLSSPGTTTTTTTTTAS